MTEEQEKAIRKDERQKMKYWRDKWRTKNDAIEKRYTTLLRKRNDEGGPLHTEESAMTIVCDAFDITPVTIRNILDRVRGSSSPAMQALTEAVLLQRLERVEAVADDAYSHASFELAALEAADAAGVEWVEVEETEGTGKDRNGKDNTSKTIKKISVAEAKRRWHERQKDDVREPFVVLKSILPQTVLNQTFDNRSLINQMDDAALDAELGEGTGVTWKKVNDSEDKGAGENDS